MGRLGGGGRMSARMSELWGVLGRVKALKEAGGLYGAGEGGGWEVVDEQAFEEIKNVSLSLISFSFICAHRN